MRNIGVDTTILLTLAEKATWFKTKLQTKETIASETLGVWLIYKSINQWGNYSNYEKIVM